MEKFEVNNKVYIIELSSNPIKLGEAINPQNYVVIEGDIIKVYKDEVKVKFKGEKRKRIKKDQCFKNEMKAKQNIYKVINEVWRHKCAEKILTSPPEQLQPNIQPRITGNPLRYSERNTCFGAQSNTWGSEINEQKIIQIIAMTCEDIEMIMGMLDVLGFMNDYAKKLLGKYLIIELNNIYSLFNDLKKYNKEYENKEYKKLVNSIKTLENKYNFKIIRDKIAAHKDGNINIEDYMELWNRINYESLNEYWIFMTNHIEKVLMKYYRNEKKMYFLLRREPIKGCIAMSDKRESYIPFSGIEA